MTLVGIVSNPTSGSGRGRAWAARALTDLAGAGLRLRDLSAGSWAASLEAVQAHRDELDALVVIGGDGMAHLGLQACAETDLPLGIVAAGSGNDIASAFGLPVGDIEAACTHVARALAIGDVSAMDVGRIEGPSVEHPSQPRYFAAVLSAGIDAAVAERARRMTFPRGSLKYTAAVMVELPRFQPYGVTVRADGEEWSQEATLVAVANAPSFGGGLRISPGSDPADGMLELVVAEGLSRREILRIFPQLRDGSHASDPRIRFRTVREVEIVAHHDGAPLPPASADGELVGAVPIQVTAASGALRVLGATRR
ncbi:diacylglycerol kinase family protein [Demequina sp. NBRC 110052]|uniref:diacylglycerol/lipid kinase family protein n=1 Tax=Demequina sp. NBRC 110052 TaxID=1570341 RepID=UPI000A029894|nr:diacylglycerol kinase family protein [Demequina sp. NBRC 110052]